MKRWQVILLQAGLTFSAGLVDAYCPPELKPSVIAAIAIVAGYVGKLASESNPDGTPCGEPYDPGKPVPQPPPAGPK